MTSFNFNHLINERGQPDVPSFVLAGLRERDPGLGMMWHPTMACFVLTMRWAEDAPQRALIRAGQLPPDNDHSTVGFLPSWIGTEDMLGYADFLLETAARHDEQIKRSYDSYNDRLAQQNAAVIEEAAEAVMEDTVRDITSAKGIAGKRRQKVELPKAA